MCLYAFVRYLWVGETLRWGVKPLKLSPGYGLGFICFEYECLINSLNRNPFSMEKSQPVIKQVYAPINSQAFKRLAEPLLLFSSVFLFISHDKIKLEQNDDEDPIGFSFFWKAFYIMFCLSFKSLLLIFAKNERQNLYSVWSQNRPIWLG